MKRVLVLVLAFDKEPWRSIETQGQRATWVTSRPPEMPLFFYYGVTRGLAYWSVAGLSKSLHALRQPKLRDLFLRFTGPKYSLQTREADDRIEVSIPDMAGNIGAKTLGAFRHILAHHPFDYVFRTNTSSYVHLPLLQRHVQSVPSRGYYAGCLGQSLGISFVGGAGILLSRDLVQVAANDAHWDWDLMDDVALARSLARVGIRPQPLARIDIRSPDQVAAVPTELWRSCFHIRCQTVGGNRLLDIETMRRVQAAYRKTEANGG